MEKASIPITPVRSERPRIFKLIFQSFFLYSSLYLKIRDKKKPKSRPMVRKAEVLLSHSSVRFGASLVTVRMLAEKYFLVIQNGVRIGQRIPIHKWMNATGGGNKVSIGMTGNCEIQMNWEKSNKVAKEHALLFIDHEKQLPMIKPLATGVIYNMRAELAVGKPNILSNNDTFKIGDTIFQYIETE